MKLTEILSQISSQNIKLWTEGDELKISAPKGTLTKEIRNLLSQNKLELVSLLRQKSSNITATSSLPTLIPAPEERYQPGAWFQRVGYQDQ